MSTDGLNTECGKGPTMLSAPFLIQICVWFGAYSTVTMPVGPMVTVMPSLT